MELRRSSIMPQGRLASSSNSRLKSPAHSAGANVVAFSAGEIPFDIRLFPGGLPEPSTRLWPHRVRGMILVGGAVLAWTPVLWALHLL